MQPADTVARLASFGPRGPASDGERRAACWLRDHLRDAGREAALEAIWARPQWQLVHAAHAAIALAGSLLSIAEPTAGLIVLVATLVSWAGDLSGRVYLLRLVLPARATQNVVAPPPPAATGSAPDAAGERTPAPGTGRVRLIVTANTDAGRGGSVYRGGWPRLDGRVRRTLGGHWPAPLGLLVAATALLCVIAAARIDGAGGRTLAIAQLVPTILLAGGFAMLVDVALTAHSPGANVNASGVAVALALVAALDAAPLRELDVELVLAGAGEGPALGMRAFVAARRRLHSGEDVAVLAIEPCGGGTPRWWTRDGQLFPLSTHRQLRRLCAEAARAERHLRARPFASHGVTGAYPARVARWPAIAIGCLDELDRAPRARTAEDLPEAVDPSAMQATLEFALALVARLDASLVRTRAAPAPGRGRARRREPAGASTHATPRAAR